MNSEKKAVAVFEHPTANLVSVQHSQHTKIGRVLAELRSGRSLNRFEAERIGDHALNSTIAVLRAEGHAIHDEWVAVPSRFTDRLVRVKRYFLAERAHV